MSPLFCLRSYVRSVDPGITINRTHNKLDDLNKMHNYFNLLAGAPRRSNKIKKVPDGGIYAPAARFAFSGAVFRDILPTRIGNHSRIRFQW